MAKRLKNCSNHEIVEILSSSSDIEIDARKIPQKGKATNMVRRSKRFSSKVQNTDGTDSDEIAIFQPTSPVTNRTLPKKKQKSLNSKFDEDSAKENEFCPDLTCYDLNTPRKTNRIRKTPARYVNCEFTKSPRQYGSKQLRNRRTINYNEDDSFPKYVLDINEEKQEEIECLHDNFPNNCVHNKHNSQSVILKIQVEKALTPKRRKPNEIESTSSEKNNNQWVSRLSEGKTTLRLSRRTGTAVLENSLLKGSLSYDKENKQVSMQRKHQSEDIEYLKSHLTEITITKVDKKEAKTPNKKSRTQKHSTPSTSKSFASPKPSTLTPSMKHRSTVLMKPATPLQQARARLHVSVVPKSLPCREEEFNDIFSFLQGKLVDGSGGCIYISGVPGTGKTATVNEAVRCLEKLQSKQELPCFNFIAINGMKLSEPRQAYVEIYKQLSGKLVTWEVAYKTLDKEFNSTNKKKAMTLILVDELDVLCTKRQDVVYNLLDWPTKTTARLLIVTIANTMDLPERVLMGRVTSRLGLTRVTFQPYTHEQLQEIILSRLKNVDAFKGQTTQLVARKVAAVSGDARRALDICRRAAEIAESNGKETVSMKEINDALTEMVAAPKVQAIKHCSRIEQMFLQAVCAEIARIGVEEAVFKNIYSQFESICSFNGIEVPRITGALSICARLAASRLLICEHSKADIFQRILLNVSSDDVHFALQEKNID